MTSDPTADREPDLQQSATLARVGVTVGAESRVIRGFIGFWGRGIHFWHPFCDLSKSDGLSPSRVSYISPWNDNYSKNRPTEEAMKCLELANNRHHEDG